MAQYSLYRVSFSIKNAAGSVVAGPYSTLVGVSGGSKGDLVTHGLASTLATAISNNLAAIFNEIHGGAGPAPGGTVSVEGYGHFGAGQFYV